MQFLARMSPFRAVRDLRQFLATRERHEFWFLLAAMAITGFFVFAFFHDSKVERVYKPNIIYVKQWKLDRTDAQIVAQQKVDQVERDKENAALEAQRAKNQAEFKRLDDKLTKWGL